MTATISSPQTTSTYETEPGKTHPLGATPSKEGVNFAIFSQHATAVELLLFEDPQDIEPIKTIALDPESNKSFYFWHVFIKGLKPGAGYAYRIDGSEDIEQGHRYNKNKVLIDPYAKQNDNTLWNRDDAVGTEDNLATSMRSVVVEDNYDWSGDRHPRHPMNETIVYEMHVKGFTKSADCKCPGTYAGVIEKIPYLKELGITAVELLPVFDFDEKEIREVNGKQLTNYWGYDPHSFFAPEASYSQNANNAITEFRDMVKALHKAGIEVILDVVFNHTNEGNEDGPIINFKGIDNSVYYHLVPGNEYYYMDYSGCGNTVNCNHPIVDKLILECLEYWVEEMHVDGFRFDEGSILSRGIDGKPMKYPPVIWHLETSEALAETKLFAEAWDAGGLYQVGYFPGYRCAEWNGKFRDDIRGFVKGDPGKISAVASRMAGSADIYQSTGHLPVNSLNFITCHDGFTLNDLVSYNDKHNEANGENNRDGIDNNLSWNCGIEGETDNSEVEALRTKQIKNFATILMLSVGVPMILSGDEVRRTQQGNNNSYCQDNELSWFDWNLVEQNAEILRFFREAIAFRKCHCHPALNRDRFFTGEQNERGMTDISWHGCKLNSPDWDDPNARSLAYTLAGFEGAADLHVMLNMYWEDLEFELPTLNERRWYRAIATAEASPNDIVKRGEEAKVDGNVYTVKNRSIVVLISR